MPLSYLCVWICHRIFGIISVHVQMFISKKSVSNDRLNTDFWLHLEKRHAERTSICTWVMTLFTWKHTSRKPDIFGFAVFDTSWIRFPWQGDHLQQSIAVYDKSWSFIANSIVVFSKFIICYEMSTKNLNVHRTNSLIIHQ